MKMISEIVPKYQDKCLEFNKYEHHLEIFSQFYLRNVMDHFGSFLFYYFVYFMTAIKCGFKINYDCSVINQSKESLTALRIVKSHLNPNNVTAASIPIIRNMISNVKPASARYFEMI